MKKEKTTYEITSYELLQICLASCYLAVYAEIKDGVTELFAKRLDGIAVAKVTVRKFSRGQCRQIDSWTEPNRVVGLRLLDGYWQVTNDDENFAGICRDGDDIYEATGELMGEYLNRLPENPNETSQAQF